VRETRHHASLTGPQPNTEVYLLLLTISREGSNAYFKPRTGQFVLSNGHWESEAPTPGAFFGCTPRLTTQD
jgi:hypothetical protein